MKELITNQHLRIDNHKRGDNGYWDDPKNDIHLHKTYYLEKKKKLTIRIPLNTTRKVNIEGADDIPSWIEKEIHKALDKKKVRVKFVAQLKEVLKNYPIKDDTIEEDTAEDTAFESLRRIAAAFELNWNDEEIEKFTNNPKSTGLQCIALIKEKTRTYYLEINKKYITVSDYRHVGHNYRRNWKEVK